MIKIDYDKIAQHYYDKSIACKHLCKAKITIKLKKNKNCNFRVSTKEIERIFSKEKYYKKEKKEEN